MFHSLIQQIEPFLQAYGIWGVFGASIVEEIIAPIPSTLVVFTSGLLLTQGLEGAEAWSVILFKIMLPASFGITIGSLFPYFLARIGEKVTIDRFGKFLGINWATVDRMQKRVEKARSTALAIFITRAIPGIPSLAVSIFSGLARVPLGTYITWTFIGCLPRNFILATLAWYGGSRYQVFIELLTNMESGVMILVFAVVISLGIGWLVFQHKRKRKNASSHT